VRYVSDIPSGVEPLDRCIADRKPCHDVGLFDSAQVRAVLSPQSLNDLFGNARRVSSVLVDNKGDHESDIGLHDAMLRADA
jgi:hypothetical protein